MARSPIDRVTLGLHQRTKMSPWSQQKTVEAVVVHPGFTGFSSPTADPRNDIAMIKLSSPVKLTDAVTIACLSTRDSDFDHSLCFVTGWGHVDAAKRQLADVLQQSKTQALDAKQCRDVFRAMGDDTTVIEVKQLCANFTRTYSGVCSGDSGGPLTCLGTNRREPFVVVGVASYIVGVDCNTMNPSPSVFTKVSSFIPWIARVMEVN
ncbi:chymotrypsin-like elastase family member 2A [Aplysia californica]|uniref:Chymotrypsin-like elastase family member 2A n=1 Tax=Aplysia californica TaxID=6500 RepID=A0ABM1A5Z0_APLCA|nr:chymotrypsin-like elastase family member 2A [Aplysia californica]